MDSALHPTVEAITKALTMTLGPALTGLYLCGSMVTGDFDERSSDIDLIAVLDAEPSEELVAELDSMHADFARVHPTWRGRIEIIYIAAESLSKVAERVSRIAVISPGEPLHLVDAGSDWVLSWYPARAHGVSLVGAPITELIPPLPASSYVSAVRAQMAGFLGRLPNDSSPGDQAYAVLSVCRGLYTLRTGSTVSKLAAARWAQLEFPGWSGLVTDALSWRAHQWEVPQADGTATVQAVRDFVAALISQAA